MPAWCNESWAVLLPVLVSRRGQFLHAHGRECGLGKLLLLHNQAHDERSWRASGARGELSRLGGGAGLHLTVDRFPRGNIISKGVVTISRWPSIFGTVVDEKTVACVDGQRYKAQLEAAYPKSATGGNERDWELDVYPFRQCWTFTWSWYRSAPPQISPCGF